MSTKSKSFEGTTIFVGMDVHKKSWSIAPFTNQTALKKFTLSPPSSKKLAESLRNQYPGAKFKCCYEAGFSGFWAQRELEELGIETIIVNAADIPQSDKDQRRKTDGRDASKIARELRAGNLEGIFIPSKSAIADRSLVRYRDQIVKDERRGKQRIKMYLHFKGDKLDRDQLNWSKKKIDLLKKHAEELNDLYLQLAINQLLDLRKAKLDVTKKIKELSRSKEYSKISYLLQSIPGVSVLGSMILMTELVSMERFSNLDQLCSYTGLVPDVRNSGDTERVIGITRRSNKRLRTFLIESAWIAIRYDPALTIAYTNYANKMKGQKAIVKIARKLLNRIRFVWLNEKPYTLGTN